MPSHSFDHAHRRSPPSVEPRAGAVPLADARPRPHQPADGVRRARPAPGRGGHRPHGRRAVVRERRGHRLHARGRGRRSRPSAPSSRGCRSTGRPTRRGGWQEIEGHPAFRGVRCSINFEPDVEWLLRPDVGEGLALLEARGIPFDVVSVRRRHLELVPILSERHPDLVHDHRPPLEAADRPRRVVGLGLAAEPARRRGQPERAGEGVRPVPGAGRPRGLDAPRTSGRSCTSRWRSFGADRLMWGSDWPIVDLAGGYAKAWMGAQPAVRRARRGGARGHPRRDGGAGLPHRGAGLMPGVAVIGASERRIPWTSWLLDSLAQYGYADPVWLVNPGYQELLGRPCLPSLDAVPGDPDVGVDPHERRPGRAAVRGAGGPRVRARRHRLERLRRAPHRRGARAGRGAAAHRRGARRGDHRPELRRLRLVPRRRLRDHAARADRRGARAGLDLQPERRPHRCGARRGAARGPRRRPLLLAGQRRRLRARARDPHGRPAPDDARGLLRRGGGGRSRRARRCGGRGAGRGRAARGAAARPLGRRAQRRAVAHGRDRRRERAGRGVAARARAWSSSTRRRSSAAWPPCGCGSGPPAATAPPSSRPSPAAARGTAATSPRATACRSRGSAPTTEATLRELLPEGAYVGNPLDVQTGDGQAVYTALASDPGGRLPDRAVAAAVAGRLRRASRGSARRSSASPASGARTAPRSPSPACSSRRPATGRAGWRTAAASA